jgi:hypothetical protein
MIKFWGSRPLLIKDANIYYFSNMTIAFIVMNKNVLACFLGCVLAQNSLCLAIIAYFCVYKDAFYEKTSPFIIVLFSLISCTEDVSLITLLSKV